MRVPFGPPWEPCVDPVGARADRPKSLRHAGLGAPCADRFQGVCRHPVELQVRTISGVCGRSVSLRVWTISMASRRSVGVLVRTISGRLTARPGRPFADDFRGFRGLSVGPCADDFRPFVGTVLGLCANRFRASDGARWGLLRMAIPGRPPALRWGSHADDCRVSVGTPVGLLVRAISGLQGAVRGLLLRTIEGDPRSLREAVGADDFRRLLSPLAAVYRPPFSRPAGVFRACLIALLRILPGTSTPLARAPGAPRSGPSLGLLSGRVYPGPGSR